MHHQDLRVCVFYDSTLYARAISIKIPFLNGKKIKVSKYGLAKSLLQLSQTFFLGERASSECAVTPISRHTKISQITNIKDLFPSH